LLNEETFKELCEDFKGVCVIAFLPHILDSSASERNNYLKVIEEVANQNKVSPFSFLWSQGGD